MAVAGLMSASANLTSALLLAPHYGAVGMALARVIGEGTLSLTLLVFAWRTGLLGAIFGRAVPGEEPKRKPVPGSAREDRAAA